MSGCGCGGKVYPQRDPGVLVRIKGQAPLAATVYEMEKAAMQSVRERVHGRRSARGRSEKK